MGHIVDVVLVHEFEIDDPWTWADNLIDPLAVSQDVATLFLIHYNFALFCDGLFVSRNADDQMHVWEECFGLFEDARVPNMVHVKHAVGIDADRPVRVIADVAFAPL